MNGCWTMDTLDLFRCRRFGADLGAPPSDHSRSTLISSCHRIEKIIIGIHGLEVSSILGHQIKQIFLMFLVLIFDRSKNSHLIC
ncbi:unnamed protein product [Protopolystoma xenopodis]|uniref:Uncharacterized protein n=1 Tax=Protopolystoma xenopodis TaxID=117903 RepID=A0A3S5B2V4_9PLAT|nr:unnamed protein product [Protopolystoma xenopodis]